MRKELGCYYLKIEPWGDLPVDPTRYNFKITVHEVDADEKVGFVCVWHASRRSICPQEVYVDEGHRRRGIATAMYDWAEALTGKTIEPSTVGEESAFEDVLSADAQAFWEARWRKSTD